MKMKLGFFGCKNLIQCTIIILTYYAGVLITVNKKRFHQQNFLVILCYMCNVQILLISATGFGE